MKTKQEMIESIYKEIANKETTLWCKVKENFYNRTLKVIDKYWRWRDAQFEFEWGGNMWVENCKIIWHDVMLWNCDKLIEKWPDYFDDWNNILDLWIKKEKPIEEQSEDTIKYVFDLLPKN